jgi:RimJ/RimL family protein N-acetyltransferase
MCVIEKSPIIETRRLTLRAPRIEDASRIAALCGDYAIAKMTTRMPWPYSQATPTASWPAARSRTGARTPPS